MRTLQTNRQGRQNYHYAVEDGTESEGVKVFMRKYSPWLAIAVLVCLWIVVMWAVVRRA